MQKHSIVRCRFAIAFFLLAAALSSAPLRAQETDVTAPGPKAPPVAPDVRDDESFLTPQKGDFVVVPIPFSNPTLNTGLVAGAAYFYGQSEQQKKVQPASVTALGALYSSNKSKAVALVQQSYWNEDRWRLSGAVGGADINLPLSRSDESGSLAESTWNIKGGFLYGYLSRRFWSRWYGGVSARFIDVDQSLEIGDSDENFDLSPETRTSGLGVNFEYDARDMPVNSYTGNLFQLKTLFNDERFGSNATYQSYNLRYRSYHNVTEPVVIAWELAGCKRTGNVPLWDTCPIGLRGFPATDYLGKRSVRGQAEARWKLSKRWGLVGFAGAGYLIDSFETTRERDVVPSYGVGVRFTVLQAKRINFRVDYARSKDSFAWHIAVGEAF